MILERKKSGSAAPRWGHNSACGGTILRCKILLADKDFIRSSAAWPTGKNGWYPHPQAHKFAVLATVGRIG